MKTLAKILVVVSLFCFVGWLLRPVFFPHKNLPETPELRFHFEDDLAKHAEQALQDDPNAPENPMPVANGSTAEKYGLPAGQKVYDFPTWSVELPPVVAMEADMAGAGVLIDATNKGILWAKQAEEPVPIASMTKLMTMLVACEKEANDPTVNLNQAVTVSRAAASMGGTQVWIGPGEEYLLGELMTAMLVASANDAAYALAEHLSSNGDVSKFVQTMNRDSRLIGMRYARFYNPHGLPSPRPDEDNVATPLDMAVLALELQKYPVATYMAALEQADFQRKGADVLVMRNHNKLLGKVPGVTGLKTGFTNRAGFCLTITCERDNRLLIAVGTGFSSKKHRDRFLTSLIEWGYTIQPPTHTDTLVGKE